MARRLPPLALAYHGVADLSLDDDPFRLFVSPRQLRRDLAILERWGYEAVTFSELARAARRGAARGLVALTFDDGLADNVDAVLPVLCERGVPAAVFVTTGWLGACHPDAPWARVLDEAGIVALHAAGIEIGSHTVTHPDLTSLAPAPLREELRASRDRLEALTGGPVTALAYPYGLADEAVRRAAAEAGYRAACRTAGEGTWSDPLDLPRQPMSHGASRLGLRLKRVGWYRAVQSVPGATWVRRRSRRSHDRHDRWRSGSSAQGPSAAHRLQDPARPDPE